MAEESADQQQALGAQRNAIPTHHKRRSKKERKICDNPGCKIEFEQKRKTQRFCSVKCRNDEFWSRNQRLTVPLMPEQNQTNTTS